MKKILGMVVGREVGDDKSGSRLSENSWRHQETGSSPKEDGLKTESFSLFHKIPHLFMMTPKVQFPHFSLSTGSLSFV